MTRETYTIPSVALEDVEKALTRLKRKADRYGKLLTWEVGDEYAKERVIRDERGNGYDPYARPREVTRELVAVVDITVESDVITKDGYVVVARLEHLDTANVVRSFCGENVRQEWVTRKPHCEHCNTTRSRAVTYIVRSESGDELQIGSSCLADYCGIDPQLAAMKEQLTDIFLTDYDMSVYDYEKSSGSYRAYDSIDALALAARIISKQGYCKSDDSGSNREHLRQMMFDGTKPDERERGEAVRIAAALGEKTYDDIGFDNLLWNIKTLLDGGYCKASDLGYIAYAPIAYERMIEREKVQAERAQRMASEAATSRHVGEIGERIEIAVAAATLVTSWDSYYGTTYLYKIVDANGNVFIWFASTGASIEEWTRIKATVKDHNEREGVKQTIVTRCKAA